MTAANLKLVGPAGTTKKQISSRAYAAGQRAATFVRSELNRLLAPHEGHVLEQRTGVLFEPFDAHYVTCDVDIHVEIVTR